MHNLRRFYYQNKQKIWKVVLIIAFLLGIIYFFNNRVTNNIPGGAYKVEEESSFVDNENKTYISEKSAIAGKNVSEAEGQRITNTIGQFLKYCKNGEVEQAYDMLSEDCKGNRYSTLEKFKNSYLDKKFTRVDVYEIEEWINNTYKITISKDLLSTGDVSDNKKQIEYITIVNENSKEKLNINSYIGEKSINKEINKKDIRITVISKKIYLDYEVYEFKIQNLSNKVIMMDTLEKIGTIYLKDTDGYIYNAYYNELLEEDLEIKPMQESNLSVKYANRYTDRIQIEKIIFNNVILDYIKYKKEESLDSFPDLCEIEINL